MERVYSVFGKPQPEHFPSGGLELPEALKEAQVNPPSGQGGLKISPLFPGHPANVFGSDARLPPEFRPMPEPPGGHFIVRKKQGDNIIHVGRAVAAQNPFPEFFPGEHLEYGVIACGPGFRFPVARRNGLGAAQPVVVEFFRGEGDAAAAGDGPGNVSVSSPLVKEEGRRTSRGAEQPGRSRLNNLLQTTPVILSSRKSLNISPFSVKTPSQAVFSI